MEGLDAENSDTSSEPVEEIKESFPKQRFLMNLLLCLLTFLCGAVFVALWLKLVFYRRFEVEWGMNYFRDPKILVLSSIFFFLMGVGLVQGIRHIILWIRECRTY